MLYCVAVSCSELQCEKEGQGSNQFHLYLRCSVLQCVAVCCSGSGRRRDGGGEAEASSALTTTHFSSALTTTHFIALQHTATRTRVCHVADMNPTTDPMPCHPPPLLLLFFKHRHCNTLQHTAAHFSTLQHTYGYFDPSASILPPLIPLTKHTLHCNSPHFTATQLDTHADESRHTHEPPY